MAWEAAYARTVIAVDLVVVLVVGVVGVLLKTRIVDTVLASATGVLVTTTTLLMLYLAGRGTPPCWATAAPSTAGWCAGSPLPRPRWRWWVSRPGSPTCARGCSAPSPRRARSRSSAAWPCADGCTAAVSRASAGTRCSRSVRPPRWQTSSSALAKDRRHGWTVTAACTSTGTGRILGVPVVGDLDAVAATARRGQHRIVSVGAGPGWTSARLHQLAWDIEEIGAEMVVDPRLVEVAGPRLRTTPVDGLPLLSVSRPTLGRTGWLVKAVADRVCAAVLLVVLAPLLLGLAFAIRSGGRRVLHREIRIGRGGRSFTLLRFRSTVADPELRVTAVGAWMRRYALDELPQLFNVLGGSMSLVGPRPPRPAEVAGATRRAFPVKPGLTGLWQVGGDVELSWEESARLDLRYVQHWSLIQDAVILGRAVGAIRRNEKV